MIKPIKNPIPIPFGYKSVLKTEWLAGNLPTVKKDVYGQILEDVTIEHLIPKSLGGKSGLRNYGLANKSINEARGNKPLLDFTSKENLQNWFSQFKNVKTKKFDGERYIKDATEYLAKNGVKLDIRG